MGTSFIRFVTNHTLDRLTDRQTDSFIVVRTRYMQCTQRGKVVDDYGMSFGINTDVCLVSLSLDCLSARSVRTSAKIEQVAT